MEHFDSFQRAKVLFSLFGGAGYETFTNIPGADSQDKFERFFELYTGFNQIVGPDKPYTQKFREIIGLMIPLADSENRKQLEIMLKMLEIKDTMVYYSTMMSEMNAERNNPGWQKDMLTSIRPLFAEEQQACIDKILCTLDFMESARQYFEMMVL